MHIVLAVVVVFGATQQAVALVVTGGDYRIVPTGGRIGLKRHDRTPAVGVQVITNLGAHFQPGRPTLLHTGVFGQLACDKGPEIDHLVAMGIDDL